MVSPGKYSVDVCHLYQLTGLFKLPHIFNLIDLDSALQKGDELFKSVNEFRYLGVKD